MNTNKLIFFCILLLVLMLIVIWGIVTSGRLDDYKNAESVNCLPVICQGGTQPSVVDDQTCNWCTENSPTEAVYYGLKDKCIDDPQIRERLSSFMDFYAFEYIPSCGYAWKSPYPPGTPAEPDPYVTETLLCAEKIGATSSEAYRALKAKM